MDRVTCPVQPAPTRLWELLFHLTLFASFFAVFFWFKVRIQYADSERKIARGFAMPVSKHLSDKHKRQLRGVLPALREAAGRASAARTRKNNDFFRVSLVPVLLLWLVVVAGALSARAYEGVHLWPIVKRSLVVFLALVVFEMALFVAFVQRYTPTPAEKLVEIYAKEVATQVAKTCRPNAGFDVDDAYVAIASAMSWQPLGKP